MAKVAEDLNGTYRSLKSLLMEFETPHPGNALQSRSVSDIDFDLWSVRESVDEGRHRKEVFFAGIRMQKSCVGFYFLPVYTAPSLGSNLSPALLKLLKGKSCFHVRSLEGGLLDHIRSALALGLEDYRGRGWV